MKYIKYLLGLVGIGVLWEMVKNLLLSKDASKTEQQITTVAQNIVQQDKIIAVDTRTAQEKIDAYEKIKEQYNSANPSSNNGSGSGSKG